MAVIVTITIIITSCTFIRPLLLMNKFTLFSLSDTLSFGEAVVFSGGTPKWQLVCRRQFVFFSKKFALTYRRKINCSTLLDNFSSAERGAPGFNFTNILSPIFCAKIQFH